MDNFAYRAYDQAGAVHNGKMEATSPDSVRFKLKESGLIPVEINKSRPEASTLPALLRFERKPSLADLELVTSKLAMLLDNGIKIDRALEIALHGINNRKLKKIMSTVHEEIRRGTALSVSLDKYPDIFSPLYLSIVKIGEAAGGLATAFTSIASNLEFNRQVRSRTRQALIYPLIIFVVCVLAMLFVFNFIVPKFSVIFASSRELPIYTTLLLGVSDFVRQYQFHMLVVVILCPLLIRRLGKAEFFKRSWDMLFLRMPLFKGLCVTLENLRFVSSLAVLLKSGVILSEAIAHAVRSVDNRELRKKLETVKDKVRQGEKLSATISRTGFLDATFDGLLEVGEQTGTLTAIFQEMEKRLRAEYENKINGLLTLIEPLMIVIMGLIVGSVVIIMLLSMLSVNDIGM